MSGVNLGCGEHYAEGWINIDWESPHRLDLRADIRNPLPFKGVTHAYMGHVLEHLTLDEAATVLSSLKDCMADGGRLMIVGPDVIRARELFDRGMIDQDTLDGARHGAGRWSGDVHLWECTEEGLVKLLEQAEWDSVEAVPIDEVPSTYPVVSRAKWQCAVSARKRLRDG